MNLFMNADLDHQICELTLDVLIHSRTNLLIAKGVNPDSARLFAVTEAQKRRELAQKVGVDAALLAHCHWVTHEESAISCRLVLDDAPKDAGRRFFLGIYLPSDLSGAE